MARVEDVRVYPVKGLDGVSVDEAAVRPTGTLAHDREFALFEDGTVVNGKRAPSLHEVDASFDPATTELTVTVSGTDSRTFDLAADSADASSPDTDVANADSADADAAAAWFGELLDADLTLARNTTQGFVDRPDVGPSVVSTATLETVAGWFDDLTVESVRRRLRANVEVGGVKAFWEDRFVGADAPAFEAGDVRFEGVKPCGRCVVPARDPDTGDPLPGFRERFVEKRRGSLPAWVDRDAFDHFYAAMLLAAVPETHRRQAIRVGDPVTVVEG